MAATAHLIPWNDGNGNIVVTYDGSGNETVTIGSDTDNLGEDRSQVLTFATSVGSATATFTVYQPTGMQVLTSSDSYTLRDSDGKVLRVYPTGRVPS